MKLTLFICAVLLLLAMQVTSKRNKGRQKSGSRKPHRKSDLKRDKKGEAKRKHVNWPEELPVDIEDSASDSMPDDFELNLSFGKTKMKFPLGKNKRLNMNLPIIYSTKKGNRVLFHGNKQLAVYKDPKTEASIIVDLQYGKKKYDGVFYIGGEEYTFRPAVNTSRFSPKHVISKIKRGSDFPKGGWKESVRSSKQKATKRRNRQKRQVDRLAQNTYDVEVLMVIDYSIYQTWFDLSDAVGNAAKRADAINHINFYFTHVANGVAERYTSVRDGAFRLDTFLSGIHIMTDDGAPWRRDDFADDILDGPGAIITFNDWLTDNEDDLPSHDHAALFIHESLRGWSGRVGIYGMSPTNEICSNDESTSINRDVGLYSIIQTFAHELGHNLGASHDGSGNTCRHGDQFVMASNPIVLTDVIFDNPFSFSTCSTEDFIENILRLEGAGDNCLADVGDALANQNDMLRTLAGQELSPDEQCQILYGSGSYYCRGNRPDTEICKKMECYNPARARCVIGTEDRAATGTTCGNNRWCQAGDCVANANAPPTRAECIYGDNKGIFPQTGQTCEQARAAGSCADAPYTENCCLACSDAVCADTVDWCDQFPHSCYNADNRDNTCCRTCRDIYRPDRPGCEYGDKADWCAPRHCARDNPDRDFCCGTCGIFT